MNGVHDLGGMHGFGPVRREENEPVFHAEWEGVIMAIVRATRAQGIYNIDESRYGIERMPPAEYLSSSYYERWLASAVRNLTEKGVISPEELDARTASLRQQPDAPLPPGDPGVTRRILNGLRRRTSFEREGPPPRFKVGDAALTRNMHPKGHTRLPRYARGKRGVIRRVHGVFVFPDTNATGQGEQPQPLYSVEFEAGELWADAAEPRTRVYLDLWESYLEPVAEPTGNGARQEVGAASQR